MNEHPVNQGVGIWTRKILVEKQNNKQLVLHDHRATGSVTVTTNQITRADVAGRDGDPISFLDHVGLPSATCQPPELYYLVCHIKTSREGFAKNPESCDHPIPLFPNGTTGKKVIALQATTQDSLTGEGKLLEVLENSYVWLPMNDRSAYHKVSDWLPEFLKLDFDTAKDLAKAAKTGDRSKATQFENDYAHLLDIILPGRVANLLAFRLLCEAKEACNRDDKLENYKGTRITIHAAKDIGQWLAPFGENLSPPDISKVAGMIGSGDVKKAAEEVLNAVNQNHDPSVAITNFLKADKPQNP
jgi:hypothetical protein